MATMVWLSTVLIVAAITVAVVAGSFAAHPIDKMTEAEVAAA